MICQRCCDIVIKLHVYRLRAVFNDKQLKEECGQPYEPPIINQDDVVRQASIIVGEQTLALNQSRNSNVTYQSIGTNTEDLETAPPPSVDAVLDNNSYTNQDSQDKSVPRVHKHPSVYELCKQYESIILPREVLQSNVSPIILLNSLEVTDWYTEQAKIIQRRLTNVVIKKLSSGSVSVNSNIVDPKPNIINPKPDLANPKSSIVTVPSVPSSTDKTSFPRYHLTSSYYAAITTSYNDDVDINKDQLSCDEDSQGKSIPEVHKQPSVSELGKQYESIIPVFPLNSLEVTDCCVEQATIINGRLTYVVIKKLSAGSVSVNPNNVAPKLDLAGPKPSIITAPSAPSSSDETSLPRHHLTSSDYSDITTNYNDDVDKNKGQSSCNQDSQDKSVPKVHKHPSVYELGKQYESIILPREEVLKSNVSPVFPLNSLEVTDWYAEQAKIIQGRLTNVVIKKLSAGSVSVNPSIVDPKPNIINPKLNLADPKPSTITAPSAPSSSDETSLPRHHLPCSDYSDITLCYNNDVDMKKDQSSCNYQKENETSNINIVPVTKRVNPTDNSGLKMHSLRKRSSDDQDHNKDDSEDEVIPRKKNRSLDNLDWRSKNRIMSNKRRHSETLPTQQPMITQTPRSYSESTPFGSPSGIPITATPSRQQSHLQSTPAASTLQSSIPLDDITSPSISEPTPPLDQIDSQNIVKNHHSYIKLTEKENVQEYPEVIEELLENGNSNNDLNNIVESTAQYSDSDSQSVECTKIDQKPIINDSIGNIMYSNNFGEVSIEVVIKQEDIDPIDQGDDEIVNDPLFNPCSTIDKSVKRTLLNNSPKKNSDEEDTILTYSLQSNCINDVPLSVGTNEISGTLPAGAVAPTKISISSQPLSHLEERKIINTPFKKYQSSPLMTEKSSQTCTAQEQTRILENWEDISPINLRHPQISHYFKRFSPVSIGTVGTTPNTNTTSLPIQNKQVIDNSTFKSHSASRNTTRSVTSSSAQFQEQPVQKEATILKSLENISPINSIQPQTSHSIKRLSPVSTNVSYNGNHSSGTTSNANCAPSPIQNKQVFDNPTFTSNSVSRNTRRSVTPSISAPFQKQPVQKETTILKSTENMSPININQSQTSHFINSLSPVTYNGNHSPTSNINIASSPIENQQVFDNPTFKSNSVPRNTTRSVAPAKSTVKNQLGLVIPSASLTATNTNSVITWNSVANSPFSTFPHNNLSSLSYTVPYQAYQQSASTLSNSAISPFEYSQSIMDNLKSKITSSSNNTINTAVNAYNTNNQNNFGLTRSSRTASINTGHANMIPNSATVPCTFSQSFQSNYPQVANVSNITPFQTINHQSNMMGLVQTTQRNGNNIYGMAAANNAQAAAALPSIYHQTMHY